MKKWKIHFVPHTHWDKEWYFTKDASNVFLVDNFEKLKEICNSPDSFSHQVYDSQLSVIDDYLSLFPEDENIINQLIKEKKLIVGPWYTQPDMFSTSGESLIRNLSYGKYYAKKRGFSAKQAYTPDSFGFNSNLPQIIKHNECEAIIQWRGVDKSHLNNSAFNIWKGIDGTKVYLYNLFKFGYGLTFWAFNSVYKKWKKENIKELAKEYLDKFLNNERDDLNLLKNINKNTNNILCFPFGSDQSPIIQWLPLFVKELNNLDTEHEWILSDYDRVIEDLKENVKDEDIAVIEGELKYGKYSRTHRTIGSSRFDIKSLNRKAENLLYNISEPLGLIYKKFTGKYPERIYQTTLKFLLESHAHDSLGGSCTDKVNSDVLSRIQKAIDMLESQNTLIKRRIIEYLNLDKNDLIIFNLMPYKRDIKVKLSVVTLSKNFKIMDCNKEIDFSKIKSDYYDRDNFTITYNSQLSFQDSQKGFYVTDVELEIKTIDGLFYKIIQIVDEDIPNRNQILLVDNVNSLVNKKLEVYLDNSEIIINDLKNDKHFKLLFEYEQDAGDTYDFSPTNKYLKFYINKILNIDIQKHNNIQRMLIKASIDLPKSLESSILITQELNIFITLSNENLNFEVHVENKINDIRLRVILETNLNISQSHADQALSLISRPIIEEQRMKIWKEENWKDMPVAIENFNSFVYLQDKDYKIGFYSNTQNEYEILDYSNSKIALTLFRAVSFIGRRNLLYRPGRASGINDFPYETPESNLNKKLVFNFNLIYKNITPLQIQESITGYDYFQHQRISDYFWIGQTFWKPIVYSKTLKIQSDNLFNNMDKNLIISAIKKRYESDDIICRIANISSNIVSLDKLLNTKEYKIYETNGLEINEKEVIFNIKGNEIKTFIFKRKEN